MTTRRQYAGGASAQTLTADLTSVATTATISSATGWPNGAVGPFAVVVGRGTNSEEKILCSGLTGTTLTIQTRGYDGTGGLAHSAGDAVELCLTAIDLDEANAHTSAVAGVHGITGNVVGTSDIQTLTNKTLTQPIIGDFTTATHDHTTLGQGGPLGVLHSGSSGALSPGGTLVSFTHGAGFTPTSAAVFVSAYSGDTYVTARPSTLNSTTLAVSFIKPDGSLASVTTCTIQFTVFA